MPTPPKDAWSPLDALEATLGLAAAAEGTYRPSFSAEETGVFLERMRREPAGAGKLAADDFEIVEKIGEGGMGVVFKAVQGSLRREVAVKQTSTDDQRLVAQFLSEAHVMGHLEHANIIPVHLLGRAADGSPLLAMKLVRGTSWKDLLHGPEGASLDLADHLEILLAVCNGVAFAHRQRFIHRDLKPDNVMVGELGQVFVMDWGIAVGLDADRCRESSIMHVSAVGSPAGTPAYMAPELARGDGGRQDERTDVYLLGACLHEVITRERPHAGTTIRDVLASALESAPRTYPEGVPRELAAIASRAMARDPEQRFASALDLQRAIEGFLEHREAHAITGEGRRLADELGAAIARLGALASDAPERAEVVRAVHRAHAEARFAFQRALALWDLAEDAREGLAAANRLMLEHALAADDLPLAERVLADTGADEDRARVDALRARLAARDREVEGLRQTARRLDWSAIAPNLSSVFIASGLLGGVAALVTARILAGGAEDAGPALASMWLGVAAVAGVYALRKLRRSQVPDSLVSPRVVGIWCLVVLGCIANGLSGRARGLTPFHDANYSATMIAIGFGAMALQTRLWLFAPAAAFLAGSVVMGYRPDWNVEVFGVLWLVTMVGVGVAFRLGATLETERSG